MMQVKEDVLFSSRSPRRYHWIVLQMCAMVTLLSLLYYSFVQKELVQKSPQLFDKWKISSIISNAVDRFHGALAAQPRKQRKKKLVLLWTPYYQRSDWMPSTVQLQCPVDECDVTSNRGHLMNSSAVIVHWRNADSSDMPVCPTASATGCPLLVLFNKEAPTHTSREAIASINDKVHWTATYRRDSDLRAVYGKIVRRKDSFRMPDHRPDRYLVCWLVSHCNTPSHREMYVLELKSYIDVQIYGQCGPLRCPYSGRLECYRWLSERCMFYLSFENSMCADYITEKLFNVLSNDMVPVVLGGADYPSFLPHRSYINAGDFSSPRSLAAYLLSLRDDRDGYLSYFEWKKKYVAKDMSYLWFCDLCAKLHGVNAAGVKPHPDVSSWWFDQSNCTSWNGSQSVAEIV